MFRLRGKFYYFTFGFDCTYLITLDLLKGDTVF